MIIKILNKLNSQSEGIQLKSQQQLQWNSKSININIKEKDTCMSTGPVQAAATVTEEQ